MPTIQTEFAIGALVTHFTGVIGMVTAIFHRSGKNTYEFSFLKDDTPTCITAEECELCMRDNDSLGFKKKAD
jgi:hypothetical protein